MKIIEALKFIPLGGLGEFGMNIAVFQFKESMIVVDCGLMFPREELLGIDIVVPDLSFIEQNADKVKGIIFTHGHEDHIGAAPFLSSIVKAPVYGTRFTLGLLKDKLEEHGLAKKVHFHMVKSGDEIELGPFRIEFIRTTHSIPDSCSVAIFTPEGVIIHTGDFKLDQTPIDGITTDLATLSRYGSNSVLALLSDSTNAEIPGISLSEKVVRKTLEPVIMNAKRRVFFTTFASHVHRVQQAIDIAERTGRKVCLVGRSMVSTTDVALRLGYLNIPHGLFCEDRKVMSLNPARSMVIISGSQGEPMSALSRVALDDHRDIHIEKGDLVIISAKIIPGNERSISGLLNHIYKKGAEVILETTPGAHVSGHPCQEELKIMLQLVRPKYFIPIHGEHRQLMSHASLARSMGIPRERILVCESGDVVEFKDGKAHKSGKVPVGMVYIDREFEEVEEVVVKDRKHISEDGVVLPVIAMNKHTGEIEAEPEIILRGFVKMEEDEEFLDEAREIILKTVADSNPEERKDKHVIKTKIYRELKKHIKKKMQKRPMIIPVVIEI
ncbi:MAG: ribonuclease J [Acidobacteriota bacterium]